LDKAILLTRRNKPSKGSNEEEKIENWSNEFDQNDELSGIIMGRSNIAMLVSPSEDSE
jgi:hypothetical protein